MKNHRLIISFAICTILASALFVTGQKAAQPIEPILIPFRVGDKWGYSDVNKKIVIKPTYDGVRPFSDERAEVWANGRCGYIDKTGREVIRVGSYGQCYPFSNGVAYVLKMDNFSNQKGVSLIDTSGRIILSSLAFLGGWWNGGLDTVKFKNGEGVIDSKGRIIVPPGKYERIGKFSEGLAQVQTGSHDSHTNGFINRSGRLMFSTRNKCLDSCEFSEGLLAMYDSRMPKPQIFGHRTLDNYITETHPSGFVNRSGVIVIPFRYQFASNFSEGLALVMENDSWFFINKSGAKKISLKYELAFPFCNGLAPVTKNGKWGFIDKTGREVVPLKYDFVAGDPRRPPLCDDGLYGVGVLGDVKTPRVGYIDKKGNEVIRLKYQNAPPFENGLALVTRDGTQFYIDKNGTEYYEPASIESVPNQVASTITEIAYIDLINTTASVCSIRVIAGDKLYTGTIGFDRLLELTGKKIRTYEEALAVLDGTQYKVTLSGVTASKDGISSGTFGGISQMSVLKERSQNDPKGRWNERATATETVIDISTDILFDFNKSTINPQAVPSLIRLARLLRQSNAVDIQLNGFTDSMGTDEYNIGLSQRRAEAVKQWLISKGGIDGRRLITRGFGREQPIAPNTNADGSDSPSGRQKNRRVEIRIPKS